jgi:hypothetical protein
MQRRGAQNAPVSVRCLTDSGVSVESICFSMRNAIPCATGVVKLFQTINKGVVVIRFAA